MTHSEDGADAPDRGVPETKQGEADAKVWTDKARERTDDVASRVSAHRSGSCGKTPVAGPVDADDRPFAAGGLTGGTATDGHRKASGNGHSADDKDAQSADGHRSAAIVGVPFVGDDGARADGAGKGGKRRRRRKRAAALRNALHPADRSAEKVPHHDANGAERAALPSGFDNDSAARGEAADGGAACANPARGTGVSNHAGQLAADSSKSSSSKSGQSQGKRSRKRRRRGGVGESQVCVSDRTAANAGLQAGSQGHGGNAEALSAQAAMAGNGTAGTCAAGDTTPAAFVTAPQMPASLSSSSGQTAPRRGGEGPFYAALDLGTNNCRLLVAAPTRPGQFRVVDAFSRIVRLGEGLAASGRLSDTAMDRAVEALKVCAAKLADRPIRKARLIATEACRAAVNGAEFLARVKAETGLDLEVVDRETEARLAVSGCSSLVERETDSVVLFDIGGGSSEIAVISLPEKRSGRLANHIRAWTSLPVGVVTLSERFGGRDVTRETFAAMVADVEMMLQAFLAPDLPGMGGCPEDGRFHLIGTSGTVTTLAGVHLGLPRYDRRRVDGLWLSSDEVDRMLEKILSWDFDQRSANPCIGADRADLVLAGCAILQGIRRRWPAERMRVADRGLREGILTDMMAADGVWRRGRRARFPGRGPRPGQPGREGTT